MRKKHPSHPLVRAIAIVAMSFAFLAPMSVAQPFPPGCEIIDLISCEMCCSQQLQDDRDTCELLCEFFFCVGYETCISQALSNYTNCMSLCHAFY